MDTSKPQENISPPADRLARLKARKGGVAIIASLILPAMWGTGLLLLVIADAVPADEASMTFGFGGIFLLMGAFFLSFVLVPVLTFVGFLLVGAGGREHKVSGAVVLALQAAAVVIGLCCYFYLT